MRKLTAGCLNTELIWCTVHDKYWLLLVIHVIRGNVSRGE